MLTKTRLSEMRYNLAEICLFISQLPGTDTSELKQNNKSSINENFPNKIKNVKRFNSS